MVDFRDKRVFETREPVVRVDPGLPAGRYRFQLVVVDADGRRSKPALVNVVIVDGPRLPDPRLVDPVSPRPVSPVIPRRPGRIN